MHQQEPMVFVAKFLKSLFSKSDFKSQDLNVSVIESVPEMKIKI